MKTIIETGHIFETRCKNCNCMFRYSADELKRETHLFGKDTYYAYCPQCYAECKKTDSKIVED